MHLVFTSLSTRPHSGRAKPSSSPLIRYRLHRQGADTVLAAADEECLGLRHEGGGRVLDLVKFASFYGEETIDEAGLYPHLQSCSSANLVGERSVGAALRLGLADEKSVMRIGAVPHLQLYRTPP